LFLWAALLFAIAETTLSLWVKWMAARHSPPPPSRTAADPDAWAKFLDALTKLLLALKDLPAWIAILLGGLALLWSAGSVPHVCS
jgi:hypothetical protein